MTLPFPSPLLPRASRTDVLAGYLDYFRATLVAKVRSLPADRLDASSLPSGWTPLELVHHLTHVERRWLVWGFEGATVDAPWGDADDDGVWQVPPGTDPSTLLQRLEAQGEVSRAVASAHDLDAAGAPSPRWEGAPPPTLERVLLHLVQEYARHLGHLDVVVELAGSGTGE
ncbi:DinB family protein [Microlunatus lacustris]